MARQSKITSSRRGRLMQYGRLAGGIAAGAIGEGVKRLARGERPVMAEVILTPANARRLGNRLAEMRGAVMKVGQLLSMEAGDFIPRELTEILAHLREDAHRMPLTQVNAILKREWGEAWDRRFERFSFTPMAAASIGQVHEAHLKDGRHLAIKLQYPGVRESIDSDVDNVIKLLRMTRLVPQGINIELVLEEAKQQLHKEADYHHEAGHLRDYAELIAGDSRFTLPTVLEDMSTTDVLTMSYLPGTPIEAVANADRATRDAVATALVDLTLGELFHWGRVQTDPNFANFRYQPDSGRIGLLDFGGVRDYADHWARGFGRLMLAGARQDRDELRAVAVELGYLNEEVPPAVCDAMVDLLVMATEPCRQDGGFDFGTTRLAERLARGVYEFRAEHDFWILPAIDVLFLHRKLGGMYLLCARLRARVDIRGLMEKHLLTEEPAGHNRATA